MKPINDNSVEDTFNIPILLYQDIKKELNTDEQIRWMVQRKLKGVSFVAIFGFFLFLFLFLFSLIVIIIQVHKGHFFNIKLAFFFLLTIILFYACKEGINEAFKGYGSVYVITNQRALLIEKTKAVKIFSKKEIENSVVVKGIIGKHIFFSEIETKWSVSYKTPPIARITGIGFRNLNSKEFCECMLSLSDLTKSEETDHS